jgi:hypothetical protein
MRLDDQNKAPIVLDYQNPRLPPTVRSSLSEVLDVLIDVCGGMSGFLCLCLLTCIEAGLILPGILKFPFIIGAGVISFVMVDRWSKSSKWF